MKTARTSLLAAGILALFGLAAIEAQGTGERGPEAGAPNLQGRSEAVPPPQQRPDGQGTDAEAPSANDEAPSPHQGCPDRGRKLELIV
jgi:hypothetical protein